MKPRNLLHCLLSVVVLLPSIISSEAKADEKGSERQAPDMNLNGQLTNAVQELLSKREADSELKGRKLRLGKVSASNLPDSSFELQFEKMLREKLNDVLDDTSELLLSAEIDFVPGNLPENNDLRVIQFVLRVVNKQRRVLQSVTKEINDAGDIALITGTTIAPPDSKKVKDRNKEVEKAFETPSFDVKDGSLILAKGNSHYAVQILRRSHGQGSPEPVVPRSVNGLAFVDLTVSDTFEIVLYNFETKCDASVDVTIDGLSVLNEFNEDGTQYEGYMVPRSSAGQPGTHEIPGWLKTTKNSDGNVFQFVINELGKGAATARKSRSSRGVINIQFFEAVPPHEELPARNFGEVGTGEPIDVSYELVQLKRRETPIANISIRYNNEH